ncbi:CG8301 [Drosophila busckii]|uniref:CG8301 n=1 Tax=Drosophila busckii TaxID=30019 RepID=A0A0M4EHL6_DROBS|nr:CG8301 [Drosophila busckii]
METCRCCAKCDFDGNNNYWLDLFHPSRCQKEIAEIRLELVNWKLQIFPNDGLPQKICSDCFMKFFSLHTFRLACQDAQIKLSNIFDKIDANTLYDRTDSADDNEKSVNSHQINTAGNIEHNTTQATTNVGITIESKANLNEVDKTSTSLCDDEANRFVVGDTLNVSYACKFCYKSKDTYELQHLLLEHISSAHNPNAPYSCPKCQNSFQDAASRTMHMKSCHVLKLYTCEVCGKKYGDRHNLGHHVEKYHSGTDFECSKCEKRFFSRKSLQYHMNWHNPERQLRCRHDGCDRIFINRRHLKCHEVTHTTDPRKSEYCCFCGKGIYGTQRT